MLKRRVSVGNVELLAQPRVGVRRQQGRVTRLQFVSTRHIIQCTRWAHSEGVKQSLSNILDLLGEGSVGGRPRLGIVKRFVEVRSGIWQ